MPRPWSGAQPTARDRARYADAVVAPYWTDVLQRADPVVTLEGPQTADLCIVGGGFTGLWAALHAKRADPGRDVAVVEAATVGYGASGRNGGFVEASLTHGHENGVARFPREIDALERLGQENFDGFCADIAAYGIDCDLQRDGAYAVALEPHEVRWAREAADAGGGEFLDQEAMRAAVASPTYLGGLLTREGAALVDPARLVDGLRRAAIARGVRVFERSPAVSLREDGAGVRVHCQEGAVSARRVILATSAFPPLLRRLRRYLVAVYDYVLMTEPLTAEQQAAIGWAQRRGIGDMGNQFHYYRQTADRRILFGGYDAVYRFNARVDPALDDHDPTFARLSQHFAMTFPQLEDVRFTHRWGGAIDTCSRFSVFFGRALGGKVSYAVGYTGLGVAATRFGAQVALDLVDGRDTPALRLDYVRRKPVPFPPEPVRTAVIQLTRNRLAAADEHAGRRGLWLRTLDRLGLGFDS